MFPNDSSQALSHSQGFFIPEGGGNEHLGIGGPSRGRCCSLYLVWRRWKFISRELTRSSLETELQEYKITALTQILATQTGYYSG